MKWFNVRFGIAVLFVTSFSSCFANTQKTVYGLQRAQDFNSRTKGSFYIQAASFSHKANADRYQHQMQSLTVYPVKISHKRSFYVVSIGPMHSAQELRKTADVLLHSSRRKTLVRANTRTIKNARYTRSANRIQPSRRPAQPRAAISSVTKSPRVSLSDFNGNWFVSVGSGAEYPITNNNLYVNTESSADVYTTTQPASTLVNTTVGRRWELQNKWSPAFSLGVFYQHSFVGNIGGMVTQYSTAELTHSNYNWSLFSNIVLASAKFNLYAQSKVSPYVTVGLGGAFNGLAYNESPLSEVTPRVSPDFSGTTSQFAFNVGGGLDFRVASYLIFNFGYVYQNIGNVIGQGKGTWSNASLNLSSYGLNEMLAGATYLYDI